MNESLSYPLSGRFELEGATLTEAVRATFAQRKTPVPNEKPLALTATFSKEPSKIAQWKAFLSKNRFPETPLENIIKGLDAFLSPLISGEVVEKKWQPGGPWS